MNESLLKSSELSRIIVALPGWKYQDDMLSKEFTFNTFVEAFGFMTKVALESEKINHHPNWSNVYSKVSIELTTHDLGGVSHKDIELAKIIERLYATSSA